MELFKFMAKKQEPKPGETWCLKHDSADPFGSRPIPVRIREVRKGWVRYWLSEVFPDNRKSIAEFMDIYTPGTSS